VVNQIIVVPESIESSVTALMDSVNQQDQALSLAAADVHDGVRTLLARKRMQQKYLGQIAELYEDFNVVQMPLLGHEVRGTDALQGFSPNLITPYNREEHLKAMSNSTI